MGLCLSQCGQAQHKAAVVAVSISTHQSSSSSARPSRAGDAQALEASQSLKRFLHLYAEEGRKLSPRPSLDDSLTIPHSSELFSLPSEAGGSDSDVGRSRSPSPSPARGSASSRGRKSAAGRFSADKPPMPPTRTCKAPARKSCPSIGQAEPHKNLVETISRLEKFCEVKLFLENRSSSFRHENSILLHDSCRELAQKLLSFANEHAHRNCQGDGSPSRSMRRCESLKEMKSDALEQMESRAPLEKSVASFLTEVENFVLQAASKQQVKESERDDGANSLPNSRFPEADEKIQFTDFEATFESPCLESATRNPSDRASDPSFDPPQDARPSVSAECGAENSETVVFRRPGHRHSRTTSDFGGTHHIDGTSKRFDQGKKPNNAMPRLALTEISTNVIPAREQKTHPLNVRTPLRLKRGVTRSLDLQDGSIPQLELGALRREQLGSTRESHAAILDDDCRRSEAADSVIIERSALGGDGGSASPLADEVAPSECQPTEGRASVHVEEEPIQESPCTSRESEPSDLESTDHTGLLILDSEKSLAMAFDNLLKLLQSPTAELAQNTSELLEILAAPLAGSNTESSADGVEETTAQEMQADVLPSYEAESWHDAPASLNATVVPAPLI